MSAFLCSAKHISVIVSARRAADISDSVAESFLTADTLRLVNGPGQVVSLDDALFALLLDANMESLGARYSDNRSEEEWAQSMAFRMVPHVAPVVVIKACHCFDYQACEYEGWDDSQAKRFVDAIVRGMLYTLPGYNDAPWGIDDEWTPATPCVRTLNEAPADDRTTISFGVLTPGQKAAATRRRNREQRGQ